MKSINIRIFASESAEWHDWLVKVLKVSSFEVIAVGILAKQNICDENNISKPSFWMTKKQKSWANKIRNRFLRSSTHVDFKSNYDNGQSAFGVRVSCLRCKYCAFPRARIDILVSRVIHSQHVSAIQNESWNPSQNRRHDSIEKKNLKGSPNEGTP